MSAPRVLIVGAGGIGHPAAVAMAAFGAHLTLLDDDLVEWSNLHRLPFAMEGDVGEPKAAVLAGWLRGRGATAAALLSRLAPEDALERARNHDVVVEGSDNFATKFLVADACQLAGVPCVQGAAVGFRGTVMATLPGRTACYRCVFEDLPEGDAVDCASAGVYGPVTTVIGALMAAETARILAGSPDAGGVIDTYDGWRNAFRAVPVRRRPDCALCGTHAIASIEPGRYVPAACTL